MGFGMKELVIILVVVILLFGTKKLRSLGSDLGSAIKSFRGAMKDVDETEHAENMDNKQNKENDRQTIEGEIDKTTGK